MDPHHTDGSPRRYVGSSSHGVGFYDGVVSRPPAGDSWCALSAEPLPSEEIARWVVQPSCGAVVSFVGTARDHSPGRPGVHTLTYEAYEEVASQCLADLAAELRRRWPSLGRVALVHRVGALGVGDAAVVVAVSAPHRDDAFDAARFAIDELKATVPIWKQEAWEGGSSWGLEPQHLRAVGEVSG